MIFFFSVYAIDNVGLLSIIYLYLQPYFTVTSRRSRRFADHAIYICYNMIMPYNNV